MSAKLLYILFLEYLVFSILSAEECPENIRLLCRVQKFCGDCMLADSCCHWCYKANFSGAYQCDFKDSLSNCEGNIYENKPSQMTIQRNLEFTVINSSENAVNAIQIKPQAFNITLRKDTPVELTFTYKAARNYPLELYYLGDLSYSMKTHLEILKNLGSALGRSLEKLTKHYKLAYGSFLDKPGMPFMFTDERSRNNPCRGENAKCDSTYLFKHSLNFTDDMSKFFEQVRNSKISANTDDLDGALEAIFQILVCDTQFGWSEYARKIILLSTDSFLHTEGDGILAGATKVNSRELCLVNSTGDHTDPLKYDYPSLGQIKELLRKHKTNLIVAVTEDKINHYEKMEHDILEQEAFVGILQNRSRNILELVNKGFYDFIQQVEFSVNTTHAPELDVQFFADCDGHFKQVAGCKNVKEDVPITFKVQIKLKELTKKKMEQIYIREKNINDVIDINIVYAEGSCDCPSKLDSAASLNCENGRLDCGRCVCDLGWKGENCSEECQEDVRACRKDEYSYICSGRGDCLCGQCSCPEWYNGKFCEFECPHSLDPKTKTTVICSGRGTCYEGVCNCRKGYTKDDCSCEESTDNCHLEEDGSYCNKNGICECNECHCADGATGTYCEIIKEQNTFCAKYDNYMKEYLSENTTEFYADGVLVAEKESETCQSEVCKLVYYNSNTQRCIIDYCYHKGNNNTIHLTTTNKNCVYTQQAKGIGAGLAAFFAVFLGGIIMILIKKWQIYREEKAEYKRFVETNKELNEMNPLYISPVSEYKNPMAR
ncbi:integrin beta-nu-like [Anthonomus grandis grandis]|uniref:integrin beta-nu-like n=1 Tax=Anthonomus grandis grandis TaxID=2921223 RepID=UPI0021660747|nr:integrin beta-nu-like [Anthonomus grandis grandis]